MVFLFVASGYAVTLHATDDTNINLNQPTQNNGASVDIFVRNVGTGGVRHAFVRFELSVLPLNTSVRRAVLKFWVRDITDPGSIDLHLVLGAWDEGTLTASNAPLVSSTPFATVPIALTDKNNWVTIDVTDVVQDWLDGIQTNFGIAIRPNASNGVRLTLDSKETTSTSHPMELVVVPFSVDISARVFNDASQSIPNLTATALTFNQERFDTDNIHDPGSTRLYARTPGKYLIWGCVEFSLNATGSRRVDIRSVLVGEIAAQQVAAVASGVTVLCVSTHYEMELNEYVELRVHQDSGGPLDVERAPGYSPEFGMVKLP
jgi:hypothetical protein